MRRFISSLLALSCLTTYPALAEDEDKWWFDIEVILFARDTSVSEMSELFDTQKLLTAPDTDWDLLTQYYQPDISLLYSSLPACDAPPSPIWADKQSIEEIIANYYVPEEVLEEDDPELADDEELLAVEELTQPDQADIDNDELKSDAELPPVEDILTIEPEIIPPSDEAIAAYWVSSVLDEQTLTPVEVPAREVHCVTSTAPAFITTSERWHWQKPDLRVPARDTTPILIHGADWARANGPHLLSTEQLTQDDLFTSIRWRKGLDRLAHFSWRQQVKFGQDNAEKLRLFAGKNYADQFNENGDLRPQEMLTVKSEPQVESEDDSSQQIPTDTFFTQLNQRLQNPQPISFSAMMAPPEPPIDEFAELPEELPPIWQLDGFMQIYLKYINRVPYLHINSELFYRQPVQQSNPLQPTAPPVFELVSIPFSQTRRVISTQLHYFDHPLFGVIVQIRRYDRPAAPEPSPEAAN